MTRGWFLLVLGKLPTNFQRHARSHHVKDTKRNNFLLKITIIYYKITY